MLYLVYSLEIVMLQSVISEFSYYHHIVCVEMLAGLNFRGFRGLPGHPRIIVVTP